MKSLNILLPSLMSAISCFYFAFAQLSAGEYQQHQIEGEVDGGNYSYFRFNTEGRFILTLISKVGDADIYVSDSDTYPTFEVDGNCLQSATCGVDEIEISPALNRPIRIGIYGHPAHLKSKFSIQLKQLSTESSSQYESMDKEYEASNTMYEYTSSNNKYKSPQKPPNKPGEDESILWTIFIGLLKVLLEILT